MKREAVLIYAAGTGSRLRPGGYVNDTNKCILDINGIRPIEHILVSFYECNVRNAVIVVGYFGKTVEETVTGIIEKRNMQCSVTFIDNDKYNYHGCEYSLACAGSEYKKYDTVYFTEADMLLDKAYIQKLISSEASNAVLARDRKEIDRKRSVILCGSEGKVVNFAYDERHINAYDQIPKGLQCLGESMQVWKFSGDGLVLLTELYESYYRDAVNASRAYKENGLFNINKVCCEYPVKPVFVDGERCINLNTEADVMLALKAEWLNRA